MIKTWESKRSGPSRHCPNQPHEKYPDDVNSLETITYSSSQPIPEFHVQHPQMESHNLTMERAWRESTLCRPLDNPHDMRFWQRTVMKSGYFCDTPTLVTTGINHATRKEQAVIQKGSLRKTWCSSFGGTYLYLRFFGIIDSSRDRVSKMWKSTKAQFGDTIRTLACVPEVKKG